jgi:hypothetical protein
MTTFHKYFFSFFLFLLVAAYANAEQNLLVLNVNITRATAQESLSAPQTITLSPSQKTVYNSIALKTGEDLIITVDDPQNQYWNGNLNYTTWDSDHKIDSMIIITNFGGYENYLHDREPLEVASMSNQSPLCFHYKAIREGSVTLNFYQGQSNSGGGM